MLEQEFILPYPPSVNEHLASVPYFDKINKKWRTRQISTKTWKDYIKNAAWELIGQKREKFQGEVRVDIEVYPPDNKRRRDIDNIAKVINDSLTQSGTIQDDWFITEQRIIRKKELLNKVKIKVIKEV